VGGDARLFLEAVLWIVRTGSPWRDLPGVLGNRNTVFKRFLETADVFRVTLRKRLQQALRGCLGKP
jgi:transposase